MTDLQHAISQKRSEVMQALQTLMIQSTKGSSVCALHKQGLVPSQVKHLEGYQAQLAAVLTWLQNNSNVPLEQFVAQCHAGVTSQKNSRLKQAATWQAYYAGQLAALAFVQSLSK